MKGMAAFVGMVIGLALVGLVALFYSLIPATMIWAIATQAFSFDTTFKGIYWATFFVMFLLLLFKGITKEK
ncbi:hypothetical protein HOBO_196 [Bacillus phage Hobo]|uniref:Uncharacterized protein n=2 Tax=Caeruleovirus BM15 TaxID=1985178 RepID=A0A0S2MUN4_9CAUD|nr:hypothetical protein FD732_gp145 [Bacillus phage BM15]ALO79604.1 hypothetical protein BM10_200 [Bacillus phage BM15]AXQ66952.1 hypothetical protein HOBO_196 [Bacillus phage Hobo]